MRFVNTFSVKILQFARDLSTDPGVSFARAKVNPSLGVDLDHSVLSQERQNAQNSGEFVNGDTFTSIGALEHDAVIIRLIDFADKVFRITQSCPFGGGELVDGENFLLDLHGDYLSFFCTIIISQFF
jgi:hypothetical protein